MSKHIDWLAELCNHALVKDRLDSGLSHGTLGDHVIGVAEQVLREKQDCDDREVQELRQLYQYVREDADYARYFPG